ncbi:hypothetical protein [Oryzomicrobium sp.]|uniref:hypothetical protein n=1 Tax=Oryzomicrobium sp. TaxID=1911578 RepID=UPI002FDFB680
MKSMDADHLVAAARAELDPKTSTLLELELLDRLEALLDRAHHNTPIADLIAEYGITDDDVRAVIESHPASSKDQAALLSLLNDEDIHEPDQLKEALRLLKEFEAIANDAGDAVYRLSQLITTAQE